MTDTGDRDALRISARAAGAAARRYTGTDADELRRYAIDADGILDLSLNTHTFPPPASLGAVLADAVTQLGRYPDPDARPLRHAISAAYHIMGSGIVPGNGATELIHLFAQAILDPGDVALIVAPTTPEFAAAAITAGATLVSYTAPVEDHFAVDVAALTAQIRTYRPRAVFLADPNNPTGTFLAESDLQEIVSVTNESGGVLILDDSYRAFVADDSAAFDPFDLLHGGAAVIIRSLGLAYGVPGLRLGFAAAPAKIAAAADKLRPAWHLNTLAQVVGIALVGDHDYLPLMRAQLERDKTYLRDALHNAAINALPSAANFVLLPVGDGAACRAALLRQKIVVRDGADFGLPDYVRVSVGTAEATDRLVRALKSWLAEHPATPVAAPAPAIHAPVHIGTRKGKVLLIQGTAQASGKSVIAAALAHSLAADGLRVAGMVAQSVGSGGLALAGGGEIDPIAATIAAAAGIPAGEWSADLNPVRITPLDPDSNPNPRCTVRFGEGRAETLTATDLYGQQRDALAAIDAALTRLRDNYELVIVEGAGAVGDFDRPEQAIANGAALDGIVADAVGLLIADAERGGAFASIVGSVALMSDAERARLRGVIVNKYRGQPQRFAEAATAIAARIERPIIGALTYNPAYALPDNSGWLRDALVQSRAAGSPPVAQTEHALVAHAESNRLSRFNFGALSLDDDGGDRDGLIRDLDICVILLPNIARFDDFDALELEAGVEVRYVRELIELGQPDLLILPNTPDCLNDLQFLAESGLGSAIRRLADNGTPVIGIGAGYQMLGARIDDPNHLVSRVGSAPGLGLLPLQTVLSRPTPARKVAGAILANNGLLHGLAGLQIEAREAVTGHTLPLDDASDLIGLFHISQRAGAEADDIAGYTNEAGTVFGTYLHGLFANDSLRHAVINALLGNKGLPVRAALPAPHNLPPVSDAPLAPTLHLPMFDRLAERLRADLDFEMLKRLIGLA